ncbi:MAG: ferritin-like domain-containing protein [Candidatus Bathyarchaeota archaeon]|nr:ferritin-like domain-containing protein [Candidatus Bathyarchaeota archaeon]
MTANKNEELLAFIKKQIENENAIVESLEKSLGNIKNPVVKGVLKGVSMDSVKHAELYTAAHVLLTQTSTALTQENLDEQKKLVQKHIDMETELIKLIEKVLPTLENQKVAFLLRSILSDEYKHHALLKSLLEIIVKGETITEEDWWKMLWEDVPFHGSPGG